MYVCIWLIMNYKNTICVSNVSFMFFDFSTTKPGEIRNIMGKTLAIYYFLLQKNFKNLYLLKQSHEHLDHFSHPALSTIRLISHTIDTTKHNNTAQCFDLNRSLPEAYIIA